MLRKMDYYHSNHWILSFPQSAKFVANKFFQNPVINFLVHKYYLIGKREENNFGLHQDCGFEFESKIDKIDKIEKKFRFEFESESIFFKKFE